MTIEKRPLSDDSFNKWRCLVALAHIDKVYHPREHEFLLGKIQNLEMETINPDQIATLKRDIKEPQDAMPFFSAIESDLERLDLIRLAHELFHADGDFERREQFTYVTMRGRLEQDLMLSRDVLDRIACLRGDQFTVFAEMQKMLTDYERSVRERKKMEQKAKQNTP